MCKKYSKFTLILCLIFFLGPSVCFGESLTPSQLTIKFPGENSIITSPLTLTAEIPSNDVQLVRVNLFDPNGTLLARQLLIPNYTDEKLAESNYSIAFDISQEESPALLTVDVLDSSFQTQQTRSVLITLLSTGEENLVPKTDKEDWVTILSIEAIENSNGKQIQITGSLTPITDRPVHFELATETGRIIGSRQLAVQNAGISTSFTVFIPIEDGNDPAGLVVRQSITPYQTNVILDSYSLHEYLP